MERAERAVQAGSPSSDTDKIVDDFVRMFAEAFAMDVPEFLQWFGGVAEQMNDSGAAEMMRLLDQMQGGSDDPRRRAYQLLMNGLHARLAGAYKSDYALHARR